MKGTTVVRHTHTKDNAMIGSEVDGGVVVRRKGEPPGDDALASP